MAPKNQPIQEPIQEAQAQVHVDIDEDGIESIQELARISVWVEIGNVDEEEYKEELSDSLSAMYSLIDALSEDDKNEMLDYVGREHALNRAIESIRESFPEELEDQGRILRETMYWWLVLTDMWSYDDYVEWKEQNNSQ